MNEIVKAVIFDIDGVLIDIQSIHYEADTKTLEQLGVSISQRDLKSMQVLPILTDLHGSKKILVLKNLLNGL